MAGTGHGEGPRGPSAAGGPGGVLIGRVAGVPVRVGPTWFLIAAVMTIGFAPFVRARLGELGPWTYAVTFGFSVMLYGSVLLHEISHAVVARALGLRVRGISLHLLGGHTEMERDSPTPGHGLLVSAAGPLVSLAVAAAAWTAAQVTTERISGFLLGWLAAANLLVGLFNLLPALPLDGGHMLRATVWWATGDPNRATVVAARAGQVLAVLVLGFPFLLVLLVPLVPLAADAAGRPSLLTLVWTTIVAAMLWVGATRALQSARVRRRLPELSVRRLARRAMPVPADLPVAEAVRRARLVGASALVVVDGRHRPTGIVNGSAVEAIPERRRPWVPVGQLARSLEPGLVVSADVEGQDLVDVLARTPGSEYLVLDRAGAVYGVLAARDVEAALTRA